MKRFDLEEYLANPNKKVITKDGRNVKIYCTNYYHQYPIIAQIEGEERSHAFCETGHYNIHGESTGGLFFAPEKHEGWVNIYRYLINNDPYCNNVIYASEEEARHNSGTACATVKVEWEE